MKKAKRKIKPAFIWLTKARAGADGPGNGWVMDYAVKGCRKIIACYAHDETRAPILVMSRKDAKLMAHAILKALKLNRKTVSVR